MWISPLFLEKFVENHVDNFVGIMWTGCGRYVDKDFIHRCPQLPKITYTHPKISCKIKDLTDALWK